MEEVEEGREGVEERKFFEKEMREEKKKVKNRKILYSKVLS